MFTKHILAKIATIEYKFRLLENLGRKFFPFPMEWKKGIIGLNIIFFLLFIFIFWVVS